jgi:hypothetical protein
MTGLEPHPILPLPTADWCRVHGEEKTLDYLQERVRRMAAEKADPFTCGYEPPIWGLVDDLLVDGNTVVLDASRLEKLGAQAPLVDVPKEILAAPEVYIAGANRSSKSEYGGKKIHKVLRARDNARTWSFADTGPISIARQQPIFWRYMPLEIKRLAANTGKARQGAVLNISYKQKTGFAEQSFVLPNGSQHWFKNYEQDIENVEGDQLDAIWLDELRNIELLRTLRGRMIDRGGIIIVTFTAIDENYTSVVNEYERGARTVFEVDAELLPIKKPVSAVPVPAEPDKSERAEGEAREGVNPCPNVPREQREVRGQDSRGGAQQLKNLSGGVLVHPGIASRTSQHDERAARLLDNTPSAQNNLSAEARTGPPCCTGPAESAGTASALDFEIIGYEKVPRIKVAGPGTDGNQRANIVYFHITDNPYFGYDGSMQRTKAGKLPLFGKERFYRAYRGATRAKILSRVYGILTVSSAQQFPKFSDAVHVLEPDRIPKGGTNYLIVDPCDGRNWFMIWVRIDARGRLHTGYRRPGALDLTRAAGGRGARSCAATVWVWAGAIHPGDPATGRERGDPGSVDGFALRG